MRTIHHLLMLTALCCVTNASAQESVTRTFYFDYDESNLKTDISQWLNGVDVDLVTSASIVGHTDSTGSDTYNMRLGMNRARAVKRELSTMLHGVEIYVASEGESQPASNSSDAENRRAELTLHLMKPKAEVEKVVALVEPQQKGVISNWVMPSVEGKLPKDAKPPIQGKCGVHFSGLLMGSDFDPMWITKIYEDDTYSEYVGEGAYPSCAEAFPEACRTTFDGIAIDPGTRLIIYSKPDFKGDVLLDVTGPAIINNEMHKPNIEDRVMSDYSDPALQERFPQEVRTWSKSNMNMWQTGSLKIVCGAN